MNKKFHMIKPFEAVIIGIILFGSIAAIFIMNRSGSGSRTAVIRCGDVRHELALNEDGLFRFDGIDAEFEIKNGKIRLTEASCPDKICEKTGYIGSSGQSIICVPNKITVAVVDSDESIDVMVG
ncbi:MAG: NusG domain II-containing protein [Oscillospiraceae bacterium]|nr:NusG domain II-containing protein [Oscillospiraceae bacterium]